MAKEKALDIPEGKAQPLGPGDPEEARALSQMGTTFAERAKAAKKTSSKAVDSDGAENKSVSSSRARTKKK